MASIKIQPMTSVMSATSHIVRNQRETAPCSGWSIKSCGNWLAAKAIHEHVPKIFDSNGGIMRARMRSVVGTETLTARHGDSKSVRLLTFWSPSPHLYGTFISRQSVELPTFRVWWSEAQDVESTRPFPLYGHHNRKIPGIRAIKYIIVL